MLVYYSPDLHRRASGFLNSWFRSPFLAFWLGLVGFWLKARDKRLVLWMALDFLGANLSGFYWGHQLRQVLPSASLAAGAGLAGLGLPLWSGLIWGLAAETGFSRKPEVREVAKAVQSLSEPSEPVPLLAHGRVEVLGLLRRRSPSPIFNGGLLKLPGALERLRENARKNPPKLVIVDEKFQRKGWVQELLRGYRVVRSWEYYTLYILSRRPSATRLRLGRSETLRSP